MAEKKTTKKKSPYAANSPGRKTKDIKGRKLYAQRRKKALEKQRRRKRALLVAVVVSVIAFFAIAISHVRETYIPSGDADYTVVIDAGHGFDDPGCDSPLLNADEKQTTAEIASVLQKKLEKRGIRVILTHNGKNYPSEDQIRKLARKNGIEYSEEHITDNNIFSAYERAVYVAAKDGDFKTDLLISLHVNSIENKPEISQYEMYYYADNPSAEKTRELCELLEEKLDNKSVIRATQFKDTFVITRFGSYPSLLFEMGYCTNEKDAANLNSALWRNSFCEKLAEGIELWLENNSQQNV